MDREETKKEKLVIEGNAFYEIDLECLEKRRKEREEMERKKGRRNGQGG